MSLAVRRMTPLIAAASPLAERFQGFGRRGHGLGVRLQRPRRARGPQAPGERVNSASPPSAASSASICRPTVGCAIPSARAPPARLPASITARNVR